MTALRPRYAGPVPISAPVYLSNAEREALLLVGFTDAEPSTIAERLAHANANGVYVPGEEALRCRLKEAMDEIEKAAVFSPDGLLPEPEAVAEEAVPFEEEVVSPVFDPELEAELEDAAVDAEPETNILELARLDVEPLAPEVVEESQVRHGGMSDADFASMTKRQIVEFVLERFGVQLDAADLKDDLISEAQALMDKQLTA